MHGTTLAQLAEHVGGEVCGDPTVEITAAATLDNAEPGQITFLGNKKYEPRVQSTRASAVVVGSEVECNAALLIADDPRYAFHKIVILLHGHRKHGSPDVSPQAQIAPTAQLGDGCRVHPFVTVGDNASIGSNCVLYPGTFVGPDTRMGDDCVLYPNVVVYEDCRIGNRVILQANAVLGQDGFGFATHQGVHHKIPQIGRVVVEDDVEIGSCAAIERGTLNDTVIGAGTKIGDSVVIGHGTRVGAQCLLVPQVGIAGSVTIGDDCQFGGQVGVAAHVQIGNGATLDAKSGVLRDVPAGTTVCGTPAVDRNRGARAYALIEYLPEMKKKIKAIEKALSSHADKHVMMRSA